MLVISYVRCLDIILTPSVTDAVSCKLIKIKIIIIIIICGQNILYNCMLLNIALPLIRKQLLIIGCRLKGHMSNSTFDYKNVTKSAMH